ncbi:hypothetical protein DL768_004458 [Monosporascus sp. mg162]|nr:hypothetical protein DL768_004458 [Monosporascus sp. mg162]
MSSFPGLAAYFAASLLVCPVAWVLADIPHFRAAGGDDEAYNAGAYGDKPDQTYHSSDLISPRFLINTWRPEVMSNESHILISPSVANQQRSPMIFSAKDLSLVYADPNWGGGSNPKLQTFNGTEHLTIWTGKDMKGWGTGGGLILDESYNMLYNVTTNGLPTGADNHEFQLTHDGGAMLNNYHTITYNATSVGGPEDGRIQDCAFQEIDIVTGEVRFEWHATDHFELTESFGGDFHERENGWDWFHMNSLFKTLDGNYLISSRHLRTLALINGTDGSRIWQVGGMNNMFEDLSDGKATNFAYQHHARFVDESYTVDHSSAEITFYNNQVMHPSSQSPGCEKDCSRGMRIALDFDAMTVRLVHEFYHPRSVQAWAQGGYHSLPNGNALIGWGTVPAVTEFTPSGEVAMDIQFGPWSDAWDGLATSYRVYKSNFRAQPPWPPSIAAFDSVIYVSWNGATEVVSWAVSGGNDPLALQGITQVEKNGFETAIPPPSNASYFRVDALNRAGNVLASTDVVELATGTRLAGKRLPKYL